MMAQLLPLIPQIIGLIRGARGDIAQKTGLVPEAVDKVTQAIESYVSQDERMQQLVETAMQNARAHDVNTFTRDDLVVNRLRGLVRPLCSFLAMGWYVFARVQGIPLTAEDYAIIGGILAFWFGFRPFEKGLGKH